MESVTMKYPKHVMKVTPGYRWDSGTRTGVVVVETDLPFPESPDHNEAEFEALSRWADAYRNERYPDFVIEWKTLSVERA
jgi:hypothetical protein